MIGVLFWRSLRDSWPLLVGCGLMLPCFLWLRLWISAQIDLEDATPFIAEMLPEFIKRLLPVPLETLTTPEGRISFGFEELPTLLIMALWTVARGTECLAGRLGDGTMEMLMAQPVRRISVVLSHTSVTLLGVIVLTLLAWIGTVMGATTAGFHEAAPLATYLPATLNFFCLGIFFLGSSTLLSAMVRSRGQAVGLFVGLFVVQLVCKIFGLTLPAQGWLMKITFLSAYEPTLLTVGLQSDPGLYWPLFWQYNSVLAGLGVLAALIATTIFCQRDLPAPL